MNTTELINKTRKNRRSGNYAAAIRSMGELNSRLRRGLLTPNQRAALNLEARLRAQMNNRR